MQKKRRATVLFKKYMVWFFKMGAGVLKYFEKIMMKIIENYF